MYRSVLRDPRGELHRRDELQYEEEDAVPYPRRYPLYRIYRMTLVGSDGSA